jgi:hypothetical protein
MTKNVKGELLSIIETPTVLLCKDYTPPEYCNNAKKYRKIKVRRVPNISVNLMSLILAQGGDLNSIEKFSSGDFLRFLQMSNIYT